MVSGCNLSFDAPRSKENRDFSDEADYQVFLEILKVALDKYQCKAHAYCMS